jgi:signal transduction histidine kinase
MKRILVIEDEPDILENILQTLHLEGFEAAGAENGRIGVEMAVNYLPDLIVCDIMMPELDGYGVLIELRRRPETAIIPFIFLTARADVNSRRVGMEGGADDYLTKPFSPREMVASVRARLEKQAAFIADRERHMKSLRTNITYAMPHELRTPLTGLLGCADLLLMDWEVMERDRIRDLAEIIMESSLRLQHIFENYLLYTQVEVMASDPARMMTLRQHRLDYAASIIANSATTAAQRHNRARDLHMDVDDAPVAITHDNLEKIITELLDNAFKFSDHGQPVYVTGKVHYGSIYVLTATDHGRGMKPEHVQAIGAYSQFEREFYEQQGLGLGLIIAKRLIELHGGQFTIESEPGRGTIVTASLPLA